MSTSETARDPCTICGEPTAVGTALFSDRRSLPESRYVCEICSARLSEGHGRRSLSDDELAQLVSNGSMAAITWGNNHT